MLNYIKNAIAEWRRSRELDRQMEEALIDPTFLDRATAADSSPIKVRSSSRSYKVRVAVR